MAIVGKGLVGVSDAVVGGGVVGEAAGRAGEEK